MDRLRWDNIARAAALLAVVALVIAWPHLKGDPPALPPAAAAPVSVEDPALPAAPERRAAEPAPVAVKRRRHPKPRRRHIRARHRSRRPTPAPAPPAPSPAPRRTLTPRPPPAPSPSAAAAHEFAVP